MIYWSEKDMKKESFFDGHPYERTENQIWISCWDTLKALTT